MVCKQFNVGLMKEEEKTESYPMWKSGEVQMIVATQAFGLWTSTFNVCLGSRIRQSRV